MIGTTKVQAYVRQIQQFDAATSNFVSSYKRLLGDSPIMYATTPGNGDGLISVNTTDFNNDEVNGYWPTLSLTGFKNPVTGYTAVATFNGQYPFGAPNAPRSKLGSDAGILASQLLTITNPGYNNFYITANCTAVSDPSDYNGFCTPAMSDADALAADTKMDDGRGDSENILASDANPSSFYTYAIGAGYVPSSQLSSTSGKMLVIRIGSQVGDTK